MPIQIRIAANPPYISCSDRQDLLKRKRFSHLSQLVGGTSGNLGDPQRSQLRLELIELGEEVGLVPVHCNGRLCRVDGMR